MIKHLGRLSGIGVNGVTARPSCLSFSARVSQVSHKPGICVKVLSLDPHSCQLQEEMAQLADCALPIELRVRTRGRAGRKKKHE